MGLMIIQALRLLAPDTTVTAMARYSFQAQAAHELGAHSVHTNEDGYDVAAKTTGAHLYEASMGSAMLLGGFDVIYDCVGTGQTLSDAMRWTMAGGCVVLVGNQFEKQLVDLTSFWYQEVKLMAPVAHGTDLWEGEQLETFEIATRLFKAGKASSKTFITH